MQNTVIGLLSALLGDCLIFSLFVVQYRKPIEKDGSRRASATLIRAGLTRRLLKGTPCLLGIQFAVFVVIFVLRVDFIGFLQGFPMEPLSLEP